MEKSLDVVRLHPSFETVKEKKNRSAFMYVEVMKIDEVSVRSFEALC
jgi:hypothetical protein